MQKAGMDRIAVNMRYIDVGNDSTRASAIVTVCNYVQGNPSVLYEQDITYTLSAELVYVANGRYYKLDGTDASALSDAGIVVDLTGISLTITYNGGSPVTLDSGKINHTFSAATLSRLLADTDQAELAFSDAFNTKSNYMLHIKATLTPGVGVSYNGISSLDALIGTTITSARVGMSWSGSFTDSTSKLPIAYDGYNYVISGHGSGTFTLNWDNTKLTPNQMFLADIGVSPTTVGTTSSVSFAVNSDTRSRYEVQFYRIDGTVSVTSTEPEAIGTSGWISWGTVAGNGTSTGYVTYGFVEAAEP